MQARHECYCAYQKMLFSSQEHTCDAIIAKIVKRCRLGQPLLLWCIAFAATSQWKAVDPRLRELPQHLFQGWTQTRINEKANKACRDTNTRENASKVQRRSVYALLCFFGSGLQQNRCHTFSSNLDYYHD